METRSQRALLQNLPEFPEEEIFIELTDDESDTDKDYRENYPLDYNHKGTALGYEEEGSLPSCMSELPQRENKEILYTGWDSDEDIEPIPADSLPRWTQDAPRTRPPSRREPAPTPLDPPQLGNLMDIMATLPSAQKLDLTLDEIISHLETPGVRPLTKKMDDTLQSYSLCPQSKALLIRLKDGRHRFVVPEKLQIPLMELFHVSPTLGAHAGARAMTMHILRYFSWKEMTKQVESYCSNCATCIAARSQHNRIPGFMTLPSLPLGPFYKVHADTIRALPTSRGYKHVLVVMCSFSKYIFTHPLRTMHPRGTMEGLTHLFTRFGQPTLFVADNGGEFHNKEVATFLDLWGVSYNFSAPYNPQANGQAEAGVKIVSTRLRLTLLGLTQFNEKKYPPQSWSALLPLVTMSYNRCPNEMTGFSPHELIFGRSPPLPIPLTIKEKEDLLALNWKSVEPKDYLLQIQEAFKEAYELVTEKTVKRRAAMKLQFDKNRPPLRLECGESVFVKYPFSKKLKKLDPRCFGPFKVTHITRHPETDDIVSVECEVPSRSTGEITLKRFPRCRVKPIRMSLPVTDWENVSGTTRMTRTGNENDSESRSYDSDNSSRSYRHVEDNDLDLEESYCTNPVEEMVMTVVCSFEH